MPTTAADLDQWAHERDTDKFVQILRYLSGDKFLNMRLRAIEVLGERYEERLVPVMLAELGDNPNSRDKVTEKIVAWGSAAADSICEYIQQNRLPIPVAWQTVHVISKFDPEVAYSAYLKLLMNHYATGLISEIIDSTHTIERFHALLEDTDPFKRWVALVVIKRTPITRTSCELLCANTRDSDVQIRSACYAVLAEFVYEKDPQKYRDFSDCELKEMVRAPARAGLHDEEALVRADALILIGSINDEESLDRVIELARDAYRCVRKEAISTLGRMEHHGTKLMLIRHYLDPENDEDHRADAVRALGRCQDEGCYEVLKSILVAEPDTFLLAQVVQAMIKLNPYGALQYLVPEVLSKARLREAISSYVKRTPGIFQYMVGMISGEQDTQRTRALIWLVGQLGGKDVLLPLCALVDNTDDHLELIAFCVHLILRQMHLSLEEAYQEMEPSAGDGVKKVFQVILEHQERADEEWNDPFMAEPG